MNGRRITGEVSCDERTVRVQLVVGNYHAATVDVVATDPSLAIDAACRSLAERLKEEVRAMRVEAATLPALLGGGA